MTERGASDGHSYRDLVRLLSGAAGPPSAAALEWARAAMAEEEESGFSERCVPGLSPLVYVSEHCQRYLFAAQFAEGKRVVDVAAGVGYGTAILAAAGAASVVGADISGEWLRYARRRHVPSPRLHFVQADAQRLPASDGSVQLLTSFETLEHVPDWRLFLNEIKRVLRPGGVLVLSTPNRMVVSGGREPPLNPFHRKEFDPEELRREMGHRFGDVRLYGQMPSVARREAWMKQAGRRLLGVLPGGAHIRSALSRRLSPWSLPTLEPAGLATLANAHRLYELTGAGPDPPSQLVAVCRRGP